MPTPVIDSINLGQSCVLEGPAASLGQGIRAGLLAIFSKISDAGAEKGKTINLINKDDGYKPDKAIHNTKALIEEKKDCLDKT